MELTPERLELASYPFTTEIQTRFGDMDFMRHLNNVAIAGIYEETRARFAGSLALMEAREPGHQPVVAQVTIRYLAQSYYPHAITAGAGVLRVSRSSFVYGLILFQQDRCIGACETVMVNIDPETGQSRPMTDAFRRTLLPALIAGAASSEQA